MIMKIVLLKTSIYGVMIYPGCGDVVKNLPMYYVVCFEIHSPLFGSRMIKL